MAKVRCPKCNYPFDYNVHGSCPNCGLDPSKMVNNAKVPSGMGAKVAKTSSAEKDRLESIENFHEEISYNLDRSLEYLINAKEQIDHLILLVPSGKDRNRICDGNIELLSVMENLRKVRGLLET